MPHPASRITLCQVCAAPPAYIRTGLRFAISLHCCAEYPCQGGGSQKGNAQVTMTGGRPRTGWQNQSWPWDLGDRPDHSCAYAPHHGVHCCPGKRRGRCDYLQPATPSRAAAECSASALGLGHFVSGVPARIRGQERHRGQMQSCRLELELPAQSSRCIIVQILCLRLGIPSSIRWTSLATGPHITKLRYGPPPIAV